MSKAISNYDSYFDWELSLKNRSESDKNNMKESVNSLGMSENYFNYFIKKWKENNLN